MQWALNFPIFTQLRAYAIVLIIMLLGKFMVVQVLLTSLSSIVILTILGFAHPYADMQKNRVGMVSEFVILLVLDILLCTSDPALEVNARTKLGFIVIAILMFYVLYS